MKKIKIVEKAPRVVAWAIFILGCGVLMMIDYILRVRTGNIRNGGVPDALWFGLPVLLGAGALTIIWQVAQKRTQHWIIVLELVAHASLGIVTYLAAGLYYVLGVGIDTL